MSKPTPIALEDFPPQLRVLIEAIGEKPEDHARRLVASDCAEEMGYDMLARCLRWMVQQNKYPFCDEGQPPNKQWTWWQINIQKPWHSRIPADIIQKQDRNIANNWYSTALITELLLYEMFEHAVNHKWNPDTATYA